MSFVVKTRHKETTGQVVGGMAPYDVLEETTWQKRET